MPREEAALDRESLALPSIMAEVLPSREEDVFKMPRGTSEAAMICSGSLYGLVSVASCSEPREVEVAAD